MKKYQIIYADPPWRFSSRLVNGSGKSTIRGADKYSTLSEQEICMLPVGDISAQECILFIWTTNAHLESCINVINAWGFKYKTVGFIWNKLGEDGRIIRRRSFYTTCGSEICLLATKGKAYSLLKSKKVNQIIQSPTERHSKKPREARKRIIEMYGDLLRIELFARKENSLVDLDSFKGWDVWGNEVESDTNLTGDRSKEV